MICPINVIHKTVMLPGGCHHASNLTTFSVLNNVAVLAEALPRHPSETGFAILKRDGDKCPKPLRYNPFKLIRALTWLKRHNPLFTDILIGAAWLDPENDSDLELPFTATEEGDYEGLDSGNPPSADATAVGIMRNVFLHSEEKEYDTADRVQKILGVEAPAASVHQPRGAYAPSFSTPNFLQLAFVRQYPYGKGTFIVV